MACSAIGGKVDGSYRISPLVAALGDGLCNGVLVKVDEKALQQFDHRERGYRRIELDPSQVKSQQPLIGDLPVWVYTKDDHEPPCHLQPIMPDLCRYGISPAASQYLVLLPAHLSRPRLAGIIPLKMIRHQPKLWQPCRVCMTITSSISINFCLR